MENTQFICDQCGLCCKNIDLVEQLSEFNNGSGICIYLDGNTCSIYKNRPLVCRISDMYDAFFYQYFSRYEYDKLNLDMCQMLKQSISGKENT